MPVQLWNVVMNLLYEIPLFLKYSPSRDRDNKEHKCSTPNGHEGKESYRKEKFRENGVLRFIPGAAKLDYQ